jgi:hypothetical protein
MLPHGRGSGDRYGVWMRGVGLSATIRQAHRTSHSAVTPMPGNWMIPPRYLAMDAVGSRAFAA